MMKEKIVACGGFPLYQTYEYRNIKWGADLEDNEVISIHILVVDPLLHGQGLGHKMLAHIPGKRKQSSCCKNRYPYHKSSCKKSV